MAEENWNQVSQSAESDTSAKQKQGWARVGTCLEVPSLARLGRKVLEPNFGNMGPPEVKREKMPPAQNLCSRFCNNDSEGGKAILPSRGINFCRLEFAGILEGYLWSIYWKDIYDPYMNGYDVWHISYVQSWEDDPTWDRGRALWFRSCYRPFFLYAPKNGQNQWINSFGIPEMDGSNYPLVN